MKRILLLLSMLLFFGCGTPKDDYPTSPGTEKLDGDWFFGDSSMYNNRDSVIIRDSVVITFKDSTRINYKDSTIIYEIDSLRIRDSLAIRDSINLKEYTKFKDSVQIRDSVVVKDSTVFVTTNEMGADPRPFMKQLVVLQNTYLALNGEYYKDKLTIEENEKVADLGFSHPGSDFPYTFEMSFVGDSLIVKATATEDVSCYQKGDYYTMDDEYRITYFPENLYKYYANQLLMLEEKYYAKHSVYYKNIISYDVGVSSVDLGFTHPGEQVPFIFRIYFGSTYNYVRATTKEAYGTYYKSRNSYIYYYFN